ncbi:hypothetical protein ACWD4N_02755 [Streptomyces sp. NPDC002586]
MADMVGSHVRVCDVSDPDANRALMEFTHEHCGAKDHLRRPLQQPTCNGFTVTGIGNRKASAI